MAEPRHQAPIRRPLVSAPAAVALGLALVIVTFILVGKEEYAYNLAATCLVSVIGLCVWAMRRR